MYIYNTYGLLFIRTKRYSYRKKKSIARSLFSLFRERKI